MTLWGHDGWPGRGLEAVGSSRSTACKKAAGSAAYQGMENPDHIELHPVRHWRTDVRQAGFPLDHPYVETCWTPIVGPTGVLLVRRASTLWLESSPARVPTAELARQLGLGRGTGPSSRLSRAVQRLTYFGLAVMPRPGQLNIYTEASPVPDRWLGRLPGWCRTEHERLLGAHLEGLARAAGQAPASVEPTAAGRLTARLDRLAAAPTASAVRSRSIAR